MARESFYKVREKLLSYIKPLEKEECMLKECLGRVLAQEVTAKMNVPPFSRSAYDGYALRARDTEQASAENPVSFKILEELRAGEMPHDPVTKQEAVKLLTGAAIPPGADAVIKYEVTKYTKKQVTIYEPLKSGSNIIKEGEDIRQGRRLAGQGEVIDPGLVGTLASQNIGSVIVYRVPKIGILSTGKELLKVGAKAEPGKIYDSNQYSLSAAVINLGCSPVILGMAADDPKGIAQKLEQGLTCCDLLIVTGGVSAGDYDLTPKAMEMTGLQLLQKGVDLKPGMACAYGIKEGKMVCALSGNPAAAITNFHVLVSPVIRKLKGERTYLREEFSVRLLDSFPKNSPGTRILRGKLEISNCQAGIRIPKDQGNAVLSSTIGNNLYAIVEAGSGPLEEGSILKGFLI